MTTEGKYAIFEQRNYRFFFAENEIEGSGKLNLEITKPNGIVGGGRRTVFTRITFIELKD